MIGVKPCLSRPYIHRQDTRSKQKSEVETEAETVDLLCMSVWKQTVNPAASSKQHLPHALLERSLGLLKEKMRAATGSDQERSAESLRKEKRVAALVFIKGY